jgi:hypothetical protein
MTFSQLQHAMTQLLLPRTDVKETDRGLFEASDWIHRNPQSQNVCTKRKLVANKQQRFSLQTPEATPLKKTHA